MFSATYTSLSTVTKRNLKTNVQINTEPRHCTNLLLVAVGPFSELHSKPCHSSHVYITPIFIVSRAVGHFSLTSLSVYTALSTLIDWLRMWVACAARQWVCDLCASLHNFKNLNYLSEVCRLQSFRNLGTECQKYSKSIPNDSPNKTHA